MRRAKTIQVHVHQGVRAEFVDGIAGTVQSEGAKLRHNLRSIRYAHFLPKETQSLPGTMSWLCDELILSTELYVRLLQQ